MSAMREDLVGAPPSRMRSMQPKARARKITPGLLQVFYLPAMTNFATPCLVCGVLTRGASRCETHEAEAKLRRNNRKDSPARVAKKKTKYNYIYKKRSKEIRDFVQLYGSVCYLCSTPIPPGSPVHVDHVYPELGEASPLAPTHKFCNESKGNKPAPRI